MYSYCRLPSVGQPRTIDVRLVVGSVAEAVEVVASLETLNRTSAEIGGLIEPEQIKEIPVSGRNWASLMTLAPGAVNYSDGSQQLHLRRHRQQWRAGADTEGRNAAEHRFTLHQFVANIMRVRLNNSGNTLTTQSLTYASPDDFVINKGSAATYLQGEGVVGNRRTFFQGYAQDKFKVTPNLTFNLGLRYEFYSVSHEILNRSAVVDRGLRRLLPERHTVLRSQYQGLRATPAIAVAPVSMSAT